MTKTVGYNLIAIKNEINIQTEIFLKSIEYLNPLCPAPVYASVKKDKEEAIDFINKMIQTGYKYYSSRVALEMIIENIDRRRKIFFITQGFNNDSLKVYFFI